MFPRNIKDLAGALQYNLIGNNVEFINVRTDSRKIKPGDLFLALHGKTFDGHDFIQEAIENGAVGIISATELKHQIPYIRVKDTVHTYGQIAFLNRSHFLGTIVGITGSCGKTSTKEMLANILEQKFNVLKSLENYNNEIGVPQTLMALNNNYTHAIIEMGATKCSDIQYLKNIVRPHIGVITSIGHAHAKTFGTLEQIAQGKGEMYINTPEFTTAIVNKDEPWCDLWYKIIGDKQIITFGFSNAQITAQDLKFTPHNITFTLITDLGKIQIVLNTIGKHMVSNALAAVAAARALNIDVTTIKAGLEAWQPYYGRLQVLSSPHGKIISDCYNANPNSTRAAIDALSQLTGEKIFVFGDMLELGEHEIEYHVEIGTYAKQAGINKLLTVGNLSLHASYAFGNNAEHFTNNETLVTRLKSLLNLQSVVLIKASRGMQLNNVVTAII